MSSIQIVAHLLDTSLAFLWGKGLVGSFVLLPAQWRSTMHIFLKCTREIITNPTTFKLFAFMTNKSLSEQCTFCSPSFNLFERITVWCCGFSVPGEGTIFSERNLGGADPKPIAAALLPAKPKHNRVSLRLCLLYICRAYVLLHCMCVSSYVVDFLPPKKKGTRIV